MIYPITFSIPQEKLVNFIHCKKKILSNLIPGNVSTYIYNNEEDYYNEYRESFFAMTTKKGGWDCLRHYEILANGCIPFFPDIHLCPVNTMALLPKNLLLEGNLLYNEFSKKNINQLTEENLNHYNLLVNKLLEYTRYNLTTIKLAKYILDKTNFKDVNNILYLSCDTSPDYLRCLTLHGFKELLGIKCHDYPKIPHIYKSNTINYKQLYGKGISYTSLLEEELHDNSLDNNIEEYINNKYFDIIIYGSYHRGMPFFDNVNKIYKPSEIILLCGEDIHSCNYDIYNNKGYNIFVRELH